MLFPKILFLHKPSSLFEVNFVFIAEIKRNVFLRVEIFEQMRFLFVFSDGNGSQSGGNSQIRWIFEGLCQITPL